MKGATLQIGGAFNECTDAPVEISFTVDYINPGFVYMVIDGGEPIGIPDSAACQLSVFINREIREGVYK